jgi:hypothetical protein
MPTLEIHHPTPQNPDLQARLAELLPDALARWAGSERGRTRLEAVAAQQVRSALLAPAPSAATAAGEPSSSVPAPPGGRPPQTLLAATLGEALQRPPLLGLAAQAVTAHLLKPLLPDGARVVVQQADADDS